MYDDDQNSRWHVMPFGNVYKTCLQNRAAPPAALTSECELASPCSFVAVGCGWWNTDFHKLHLMLLFTAKLRCSAVAAVHMQCHEASSGLL